MRKHTCVSVQINILFKILDTILLILVFCFVVFFKVIYFLRAEYIHTKKEAVTFAVISYNQFVFFGILFMFRFTRVDNYSFSL